MILKLLILLVGIVFVYNLWHKYTVSGNIRRLRSRSLFPRTSAASFLTKRVVNHQDSKAIYALIKLLHSNDVSLIKLGIKSLIDVCPTPLAYCAFPDLTEALKHSDTTIRLLAVNALSIIARDAMSHHPEYTEHIAVWFINVLANEGARGSFASTDVITCIIETFANISSVAKPYLVEALKNKNIMKDASEHFILAYARVLFANRAPIANLIDDLESTDKLKQLVAVAALGYYGSRAKHTVPKIRELLESGDPEFFMICRASLYTLERS